MTKRGEGSVARVLTERKRSTMFCTICQSCQIHMRAQQQMLQQPMQASVNAHTAVVAAGNLSEESALCMAGGDQASWAGRHKASNKAAQQHDSVQIRQCPTKLR